MGSSMGFEEGSNVRCDIGYALGVVVDVALGLYVTGALGSAVSGILGLGVEYSLGLISDEDEGVEVGNMLGVTGGFTVVFSEVNSV